MFIHRITVERQFLFRNAVEQQQHQHEQQQLRSHEFHQQTTYRTRKGVPLQQILDASETNRNRKCTSAERNAGNKTLT